VIRTEIIAVVQIRFKFKPLSIYPIIEKLVLWAGSEQTGYAVEKCCGMMEYWNVGIMG
jgi:hypothetical protein